MIWKKVVIALCAMVGLALATPVSAQTGPVLLYNGTPLFGPQPLTAARLELTLGSTINALGGYDITGVSGRVNGDIITGLIPIDPAGTPVCPCFPEGLPVLGGYLSVGNTYYPGAGDLLDHGGIGFQSASSYYNLYALGAGAYELFSIPVGGVPTDVTQYPDVFSVSDGILAVGVPEPATWALMILGFGAVGGAMRRRQAVDRIVAFS